MALWLLQPEDSVTRVLRGVRVEWLDDHESHKYFSQMLSDPESPLDEAARALELAKHERLLRDHDSTFRSECERLGRKWPRPDRIDVTRELGRLQIEQSPESRVLLLHTWRSLAGLQHGNAGALLRVSDMVERASGASGSRVRLSPSDSSFQTLAEITALLTMQAFARYLECHRPRSASGYLDLSAALKLREEWDAL